MSSKFVVLRKDFSSEKNKLPASGVVNLLIRLGEGRYFIYLKNCCSMAGPSMCMEFALYDGNSVVGEEKIIRGLRPSFAKVIGKISSYEEEIACRKDGLVLQVKIWLGEVEWFRKLTNRGCKALFEIRIEDNISNLESMKNIIILKDEVLTGEKMKVESITTSFSDVQKEETEGEEEGENSPKVGGNIVEINYHKSSEARKRECSTEKMVKKLLSNKRGLFGVLKSLLFEKCGWESKKDEFSLFVDPLAKLQGEERGVTNVTAERHIMDTFLGGTGRSMLVLGCGGSGKTFLGKKIVHEVFANKEDWIAIYHYLPNTAPDKFQQRKFWFLPESLQNENFLPILRKSKILLILDGYDELPKIISPYSGLPFAKEFPLMNVITLGREAEMRLKMSNFDDRFRVGSFSVMELQDFDKRLINDYVSKNVIDAERKKKFLKMVETKQMQELCSKPIFLKILFYLIVEEEVGVDSSLTIVNLFDRYFKKYFKNEENRHLNAQSFNNCKAIYGHLALLFDDYCKNLAKLKFYDSSLRILISEEESVDPKLIQHPTLLRFRESLKKADMEQIRRSCLIIPQGQNFAFSHKKFIEHFLMKEMETSIRQIALGLEESFVKIGFSFCINNVAEEIAVCKLLVDRIKIDQRLVEDLLKLVYKSRDRTKQLGLAPSNAITLLNFAGFPFCSMDLRNIRIPRADMSKAMCYNCDFTGSDLSFTNFTDAKIDGCTFNDCVVLGATFGESGKMYGISSKNGEFIYLTDGYTVQCCHDRKGSKKSLKPIPLRSASEEVSKIKICSDPINNRRVAILCNENQVDFVHVDKLKMTMVIEKRLRRKKKSERWAGICFSEKGSLLLFYYTFEMGFFNEDFLKAEVFVRHAMQERRYASIVKLSGSEFEKWRVREITVELDHLNRIKSGEIVIAVSYYTVHHTGMFGKFMSQKQSHHKFWFIDPDVRELHDIEYHENMESLTVEEVRAPFDCYDEDRNPVDHKVSDISRLLGPILHKIVTPTEQVEKSDSTDMVISSRFKFGYGTGISLKEIKPSAFIAEICDRNYAAILNFETKKYSFFQFKNENEKMLILGDVEIKSEMFEFVVVPEKKILVLLEVSKGKVQTRLFSFSEDWKLKGTKTGNIEYEDSQFCAVDRIGSRLVFLFNDRVVEYLLVESERRHEIVPDTETQLRQFEKKERKLDTQLMHFIDYELLFIIRIEFEKPISFFTNYMYHMEFVLLDFNNGGVVEKTVLMERSLIQVLGDYSFYLPDFSCIVFGRSVKIYHKLENRIWFDMILKGDRESGYELVFKSDRRKERLNKFRNVSVERIKCPTYGSFHFFQKIKAEYSMMTLDDFTEMNLDDLQPGDVLVQYWNGNLVGRVVRFGNKFKGMFHDDPRIMARKKEIVHIAMYEGNKKILEVSAPGLCRTDLSDWMEDGDKRRLVYEVYRFSNEEVSELAVKMMRHLLLCKERFEILDNRTKTYDYNIIGAIRCALEINEEHVNQNDYIKMLFKVKSASVEGSCLQKFYCSQIVVMVYNLCSLLLKEKFFAIGIEARKNIPSSVVGVLSKDARWELKGKLGLYIAKIRRDLKLTNPIGGSLPNAITEKDTQHIGLLVQNFYMERFFTLLYGNWNREVSFLVELSKYLEKMKDETKKNRENIDRLVFDDNV